MPLALCPQPLRKPVDKTFVVQFLYIM
jgi:hypothetical protein